MYFWMISSVVCDLAFETKRKIGKKSNTILVWLISEN